jgi:hypothetical protein
LTVLLNATKKYTIIPCDAFPQPILYGDLMRQWKGETLEHLFPESVSLMTMTEIRFLSSYISPFKNGRRYAMLPCLSKKYVNDAKKSYGREEQNLFDGTPPSMGETAFTPTTKTLINSL